MPLQKNPTAMKYCLKSSHLKSYDGHFPRALSSWKQNLLGSNLDVPAAVYEWFCQICIIPTSSRVPVWGVESQAGQRPGWCRCQWVSPLVWSPALPPSELPGPLPGMPPPCPPAPAKQSVCELVCCHWYLHSSTLLFSYKHITKKAVLGNYLKCSPNTSIQYQCRVYFYMRI